MLSINAQYIVDAVTLISEKEGIVVEKAFDKLLNYCASLLEIDDKVFSHFRTTTYDELKRTFDLIQLFNVGDWFGEAYEYLNLCDVALLDQESCNCKVACVETNPGQFPKVVLCKNIQSGRILLSLLNTHGNRVVIYGVESNLTLYRIALINIKMFRIPAFVLRIDENLIESRNLSTSSPNWEFSNVWTTPDSMWIK